MFNQTYKICTVFGIPIYLNLTTICILFFFLGMTGSIWLDVVCIMMLLVSIVVHELGHSLTARCFGCPTRYIVLSAIGGCATLENIPRKAWQEFLTAAAGPATSFLLAVVMYIASEFCPDQFTASSLFVTGIINFTLAAFNLLPGFPMDGGRIFRSIARMFTTRVKATYLAMVVGRVAAVLLVVGPFLGIDHIWIIPIGGNFFLRLWIAFMIWVDGMREYRQTVAEESWRGGY